MHSEDTTLLCRVGDYYSVGERIFATKAEAYEVANRLGKTVSYHENDEFWAKQPWLIPLLKPLSSLYMQRAYQLREKYDYLILCYSGGADSHNILKTFNHAEIHLDEINIWHDMSLTEDPMSLTNGEVFKVAIPNAQEFVRKWPRTKLEVIDMKVPMQTLLTQHSVDEIMLHFLQSMASAGHIIRSGAFVYTNPRYKQLLEQGKKVAIIWGWDKTLVWKVDDYYVHKMSDSSSSRYRCRLLYPDIPVASEFFYQTLDLPQLVIKQCQTLVQRLKTLPKRYIDPFPIDDDKHRLLYVQGPNNQKVSLETVNLWLYDETPWFTAHKAFGTQYFSALDRDWILRARNEELMQKWKMAMLKMYELQRKKMPVLYTRPYVVGSSLAQ